MGKTCQDLLLGFDNYKTNTNQAVNLKDLLTLVFENIFVSTRFDFELNAIRRSLSMLEVFQCLYKTAAAILN